MASNRSLATLRVSFGMGSSPHVVRIAGGGLLLGPAEGNFVDGEGGVAEDVHGVARQLLAKDLADGLVETGEDMLTLFGRNVVQRCVQRLAYLNVLLLAPFGDLRPLKNYPSTDQWLGFCLHFSVRSISIDHFDLKSYRR